MGTRESRTSAGHRSIALAPLGAWPLLLLLFQLSSCLAPFPDLDQDNDGYLADDCDDSNAEIHPGAAEFCDGIDNNCDDVVDGDDAQDRAVWYIDQDGDGYGSPTFEKLACEQPEGFTPVTW